MAVKGGLEALAPAGVGWAVTPSDSAGLADETRAVYIGGAGNMVCEMVDPAANKLASVTFTNLNSGSVYPIRTSKILATGPTATGIVALA